MNLEFRIFEGIKFPPLRPVVAPAWEIGGEFYVGRWAESGVISVNSGNGVTKFNFFCYLFERFPGWMHLYLHKKPRRAIITGFLKSLFHVVSELIRESERAPEGARSAFMGGENSVEHRTSVPIMCAVISGLKSRAPMEFTAWVPFTKTE